MTVPISAFIITRNEEARLGATLAALDWVDQIVVVDSGSSDDTAAVARNGGAEFHFREWEGYGQQKSHAETLCRHDWVLNIDADEVVTPELAAEIQHLMASTPEPAGYRVRILNIYPGADKPRPLANDYNVVRLYHRSAGGYREHPLFDRVVLNDGMSERQLRAPIHHFSLHSWEQMVEKENVYSSFNAQEAKPRAHWMLIIRLVVQMPLTFLRFYFLRGHILGGHRGFMFALTAAFARTLRIAKMLERGDTTQR